uniref:HDC12276 n=1 Tax=Drosophila melanogaster TaxID=7227 RepID=Q6IKJ6_DROME|nr:TPA_inf: HDC12276 [Drosophila melanogaster]
MEQQRESAFSWPNLLQLLQLLRVGCWLSVAGCCLLALAAPAAHFAVEALAKRTPNSRNAQGSPIKINRIEATGAGTGRERDWDRDRDCRDNKRCSMPTEWAEYGGKRKLGLFMARYE